MKQVVAAVVVGLLVVGYGMHRAAGQMPQCDREKAGAAPGRQYGTEDDVAAKKQADAEKFRTAEANSATQACKNLPAPVKDTAPNRK